MNEWKNELWTPDGWMILDDVAVQSCYRDGRIVNTESQILAIKRQRSAAL